MSERIGPYKIITLLGKGGMAAVYKAVQPSLNRDVAIKVLPPEFARDPERIERFHREAHAVARLNHPNIVHIIDKAQDGETLYFVMEYVEGTSLGVLLFQRRLSLADALQIAKEVGRALEYSHRHGIVHRDLKPANILVSPDLSIVKLADFGISRLDDERRTLTTTQSTLGTLHYCAPEQMENPRGVDHRADIYALGVICYEMLTGRVPLGRFRLPSQLNPQLPPELDRIVLRCLASEPAERYPNATAFLADVEALEQTNGFRLVAELKLLGRSTSRLLRSSTTRVAKRWKTWIIAAASMAVVVLLMLAVILTRHSEPEAPSVPSPPAATRPMAPTTPSAPDQESKPAPGLARDVRRDLPREAARRVSAASRKAAAIKALEIARSKAGAGLYDPALADLSTILRDPDSEAVAADALLLIASIHERRKALDDVRGSLLEFAERYSGDSRVGDVLVKLARLTAKTKGKERAAHQMLEQMLGRIPLNASLIPALVERARLEERLRRYERDPELAAVVPSALVTYRMIAMTFPTRPEAELALWKMGDMLEGVKRYIEAAAIFAELGTRFPSTTYDAWFRAGQLFEREIKDRPRAKHAYLRVVAASPKYREAQRRLARLR